VRPRVDHGGGTRLLNDGVVEQRSIPGRLQTTASVLQLTGVADLEWSIQQWHSHQCPVNQLSQRSRLIGRTDDRSQSRLTYNWLKMRAFRQYYQLISQVAHVSRQSNNRSLSFALAQTGWARNNRTGAIPWARHGKQPTERRTHSQARSYTSVHEGGQTNTHKGTKRETGVSGNGLGNPTTTSSPANLRFIKD